MSNTGSQDIDATFERKLFIVIQSDHYEIHRGKHFTYSDSIILASAATQDYVIVTTDDDPHCLFNVTSIFQVGLELFEGTDKTPTTIQTIRNRNRNSSNTPDTSIYKGSSGGTTDGTQLLDVTIGAATGPGSIPIEVRGEQEWLLKPNTKYIFRITSGANNNVITFNLEWYE